jgi:hypothetical protein
VQGRLVGLHRRQVADAGIPDGLGDPPHVAQTSIVAQCASSTLGRDGSEAASLDTGMAAAPNPTTPANQPERKP